MIKLRKLIVAMAILLAPLAAHAIDHTYLLNVPTVVDNLTETSVLVSSLSNTGAVLAANADRIGFDIQITTCPAAAPRVWYSFDSTGVSTITASATNLMNMYVGGTYTDSQNHWVRQPDGIIHQGPIYMRAEQTGCYAIVREWTSSSPLLH